MADSLISRWASAMADQVITVTEKVSITEEVITVTAEVMDMAMVTVMETEAMAM